jgi:hypothetical protein
MDNKKVKSLLHLCALGALRNVPEIRSYYLRKIEEGKPAMLVINAIRFKLILRIFACINQDRCYVDRNELPMLSANNAVIVSGDNVILEGTSAEVIDYNQSSIEAATKIGYEPVVL